MTEGRTDCGAFDCVRYGLMPRLIAPHADKLRAAEVAAGHGEPLARRCGTLRAQRAKIFDPIPFEQRPVFVVDNGPAFGGDKRLA